MVDYVEFLCDGLAKDDGLEHADGHVYETVANLVSVHGDDGAAAAWNYACEGAELNEAIRITTHRFKGHYADVGAFARAMLAGSVDDAASSSGFDVTVSDHVNWDGLGDELTDGDDWYVIVVDSGVYVWDVADTNDGEEITTP